MKNGREWVGGLLRSSRHPRQRLKYENRCLETGQLILQPMASYFLGTDQLNQVTEHEKPNQPNQLKMADSIRERPKFLSH